MTRGTTLLGALALFGLGIVSANAADMTTMTCAEFTAMDAPAKLGAAGELLAWVDTSADSTGNADLIGKYTEAATEGQIKPEDFVVEIEGHCIDADPAMTVVERLKTHS